MKEQEIQKLFVRANNLPQKDLIKISLLGREYWSCWQDLCKNENGFMIKLDLATEFFEEYYCAILVTPEEFEKLLQENEQKIISKSL